MRSAGLRAGALAIALATLPAMAEGPATGAFLYQLEGRWEGAGQVSGMTGDMSMIWEKVLDGAFHRLTMQNRLTGKDGNAWHFKAEAYYRVLEDGSIAGQWFDSRGFNLPLVGRVEGNAMTIDWGTEASPERGRSIYRQTASDALEVTDEVYGKDGTLTVFGRTRLTRK